MKKNYVVSVNIEHVCTVLYQGSLEQRQSYTNRPEIDS